MTARKEDGYNKVLPSRIRAILDKKKMRRNDLADKTGITRQRIGYYAAGTNVPDAEALTKIAKALEVSADYLLGLTDDDSQQIHSVTTYADAALTLEALTKLTSWSILTSARQISVADSEDYTVYNIVLSMGQDDTLFNFFNTLVAMQKTLNGISQEDMTELIEAYKEKLLKALDKPIVPHGFTLVDDEELPFGDGR